MYVLVWSGTSDVISVTGGRDGVVGKDPLDVTVLVKSLPYCLVPFGWG